jgi:GxxExxY protein
MTENEVAKQIVDVAFKIHTTFGPGLLESVYETIMAYELQKRGLSVRRQQAIPVIYEDVRLGSWFPCGLDR